MHVEIVLIFHYQPGYFAIKQNNSIGKVNKSFKMLYSGVTGFVFLSFTKKKTTMLKNYYKKVNTI